MNRGGAKTPGLASFAWDSWARLPMYGGPGMGTYSCPVHPPSAEDAHCAFRNQLRPLAGVRHFFAEARSCGLLASTSVQVCPSGKWGWGVADSQLASFPLGAGSLLPLPRTQRSGKAQGRNALARPFIRGNERRPLRNHRLLRPRLKPAFYL